MGLQAVAFGTVRAESRYAKDALGKVRCGICRILEILEVRGAWMSFYPATATIGSLGGSMM